MTRDGSRVWLIAACYGLWAGFCAVATFAVVIVLWQGFWHSDRSTAEDVVELLPYAAFTAIVAAVSWAILHRRSRQPSPGAYIALALAIVIVVHTAISFNVSAGTPPGTFFTAIFFGLVFHFWFTVPIAAGATGVFVWCLKRWKQS